LEHVDANPRFADAARTIAAEIQEMVTVEEAATAVEDHAAAVRG